MASKNKKTKDKEPLFLGRKPKPFDVAIFEKLCQLACTKVEISAFFNFDENTLTRKCKENFNTNFKGAYKVFSSGGRMSLRRMQFKSAEAGSVAMQIWLGKQHLDQCDNVERKTGDEEEQITKVEIVRRVKTD